MEHTEMEIMERERLQKERLEKAAFRLGVSAIISTFLIPVFLPFILGSIAIVLAFLSRGGDMKFTKRGKLAVILGFLAIALNIAYIIYVSVTMYSLLSTPAGRQQVSDFLYRMYGMTLEEFLGQLGITQ